MTENFRDLCAELVSCWDNAVGDPDFCDVADTMDRARAALAEGAGVGVNADPIPRDLIRRLADALQYRAAKDNEDFMMRGFYPPTQQLIDAARAYLAKPEPVRATHPRPIPPLDATRQLILKLTAELARLHDSEPQTLDLIAEARAFIDADHPRPIPVSERLPTETDCDAEGRCWWLTCGSEATAPYWYLADCEYPARAFPFDPSAWLPAAAIPLPEGES